MAIPANQALFNMNADLFAFFTLSLNFTPALCNCLSFDGYDLTLDFVDWTFSEIKGYCENKSGRTAARGGCNWPDRKKKDLQGFVHYVTQHSLEGVQVNVAELDTNGDHVLTLAIVQVFYEAAKIAEDKGDEMEKKKPDVLKSEDWVQRYDHYYSSKDFHALSQDTRDAILKARKDNNYVPGGRNRNVNATVTDGRNDDDVSSIGHSLAGHTITMDASVLRGVMAGSTTGPDWQHQGNPPSNGSHACVNASTSSKKLKVTYDANGSISHVGES